MEFVCSEPTLLPRNAGARRRSERDARPCTTHSNVDLFADQTRATEYLASKQTWPTSTCMYVYVSQNFRKCQQWSNGHSLSNPQHYMIAELAPYRPGHVDSFSAKFRTSITTIVIVVSANSCQVNSLPVDVISHAYVTSNSCCE